ncbi:DUF1929-domain-containing protein [Teratosphaeria nubilosa]|uniref:DUF1929-domain-containing protein n=1 Tax=Teratosphaeria nubilosa TaxID=161662 RepID=A0A6G1KSI1_9PEZI|nr:DUF1929-domain-containing protein [Teratosphaeria nubilosa]
MTDGILLPTGHILFINGAHKGSAGGFMAEDPVTQPLLYHPTAQPGHRFTKIDARTTIPRLYHSIAQLLPSGEILLAGSNPSQARDSHYPTEYRVEIFTPPYLESPHDRPVIHSSPAAVKHGADFELRVAQTRSGETKVRLSCGGFRTHAEGMGQRVVELEVLVGGHGGETVRARAPRDASVAPPGAYLLWYVVDGVPAEGKWIRVEM